MMNKNYYFQYSVFHFLKIRKLPTDFKQQKYIISIYYKEEAG